MYVYQQTEPELWTVGYFRGGVWNPQSDHGSEGEARLRVSVLNGEIPAFIAEIDWPLLRRQKLALLNTGTFYGLVGLIDAIQDYAVEMGVKESKVFGPSLQDVYLAVTYSGKGLEDIYGEIIEQFLERMPKTSVIDYEHQREGVICLRGDGWSAEITPSFGGAEVKCKNEYIKNKIKENL